MALKRIVLRDFVIISELELDLERGFTVLTGETGAGKSILVDALQLVTGARADVGVIREGAARTDVSAEFDNAPALQALLDDAGFDAGDSLLLRRTVDTQGKSRAWVNGSPATAQQLRSIGEQLIDIHGQHAWQSLTRPDAIRGLLDAYARLSTQTLSQLWDSWRVAQTALQKATQAQDSLQRERERLAWQIGELEKLNPLPDEWPELNTSRRRPAGRRRQQRPAGSAQRLATAAKPGPSGARVCGPDCAAGLQHRAGRRRGPHPARVCPAHRAGP
jgi:DNA repair protein RecN (Recombination protein N)